MPQWRIAYVDEGHGDPVILLQDCPYSAFEWSKVLPLLYQHYRVIAPELLELGDTEVRLNQDYRLPVQAEMLVSFRVQK